MANTYAQIHIQAVFAVKYRLAVIEEKWETQLYKYITGIVQNNKHKLIAINGMPDHVHVFFGMRPDQSLSNLMQDIKSGSSKWINDSKFLKTRFEWQESFGAFSYSRSQIPMICEYIQNQKEHHKTVSFRTEYTSLLKEFEVDFDERYIFTDPR